MGESRILDDLESKVKLEATDDFIKRIVRGFLSIDPNKFNGSNEASSYIYDQLRIDQNSIGKVNEEDYKKFFDELHKDYIAHGDNYRSNPLSEQPGFYTFKSWHLLGTEKIPYDESIHRLYINSKAQNIMILSNTIYDEFKNNNIPFYFKIQGRQEDRKYFEEGYKDSIVIYTSTKYLKQTIQALLNIEKQIPELVANCNAPSELVGKFNSWIGYASETKEHKHSYTDNVCIAIYNAIEKSVKEWCENHPNVKIGNQSIKDYYHDSLFHDEKPRKEQVLVSNIPKIDSTFVKRLCDIARLELINIGLNPNNVCMTDTAKREIDKQINKFGEEITRIQDDKSQLIRDKIQLINEKNNVYQQNQDLNNNTISKER